MVDSFSTLIIKIIKIDHETGETATPVNYTPVLLITGSNPYKLNYSEDPKK